MFLSNKDLKIDKNSVKFDVECVACYGDKISELKKWQNALFVNSLISH